MSEADWSAKNVTIGAGNDPLVNATWHFLGASTLSLQSTGNSISGYRLTE